MTIDSKKIMNGLECCGQNECDCKECPYFTNWDEPCNHGQLQSDALALIRTYRTILKRMEAKKNAVSKQTS